ncbi:hypothetical protein LFZ31_17755 [Salmonella enterica subsp. enterica serovar Newport str. S09097]|nr:hypothetical protein LFZ31_17755 [Salmonella enterica subsp. enterica serovar Newport str. S09097]
MILKMIINAVLFSRVINVTASAEKNRFLRLQPKPPVDEFLEIMKCETGFQNLSFGANFLSAVAKSRRL